MTNRVKKAIDIFLDAINNGTLRAASCKTCAVGNLVANAMGLDLTKVEDEAFVDSEWWGNVFYTVDGVQNVYMECYKGKPKENIDSTDFSLAELMKIEYAFENHTRMKHINYDLYTPEQIRADQIRGLSAVIDVMLTFDDVDNKEEIIQNEFINKAKLIEI